MSCCLEPACRAGHACGHMDTLTRLLAASKAAAACPHLGEFRGRCTRRTWALKVTTSLQRIRLQQGVAQIGVHHFLLGHKLMP